MDRPLSDLEFDELKERLEQVVRELQALQEKYEKETGRRFVPELRLR